MDPARMRLTATSARRSSWIRRRRLPPGCSVRSSARINGSAEQTCRRAACNSGFQESTKTGRGEPLHQPARKKAAGTVTPGHLQQHGADLPVAGYVVIYAEMIILAHHPGDGRPHLPDNVETWLGDARGRWEGNTRSWKPGLLTPSDVAARAWSTGTPIRNVRIVEKFTRVGPETITYEVTMSDPETWTRPFTIMVQWNKTNEQIYEYQCQELNYDMYHWLHGAASGRSAASGSIPMRPTHVTTDRGAVDHAHHTHARDGLSHARHGRGAAAGSSRLRL